MPDSAPPPPQDWDHPTVGELASHVGSGATPRGGQEIYTNEGILFIRSQNVTFAGLRLDDVAFISQRIHRQMQRSEVFANDVLLNITGASIGRCCPVPQQFGAANVNQHVCAIRLPQPKPEDAMFLSSVLASPIGQMQIDRVNVGGNREGLNFAQVRSLRVPWPKPRERSCISQILDTMDAAIRETESVVAKLRQVKAGMLQDLLTRGLDEHGRLRDPARHPEQFKDSPLGLIPKDWDVVPLGQPFDMQLGKMMSKDAKRGRRPLPYLGNRSVQWERADLSALEFMDFNEAEEENFGLQPGDALVCEGGEVGRTAIWRGEIDRCCLQKAVHRLRPKTPNASTEFLLMFMRRAVDLGWLQNYTSQTSIAHLTQEKLAIVPFLNPKPDEQRAIATAFRKWNERISAQEAELSKLQDLKRGLAHDLLTGRVRVKVCATGS